MTFLGFTCREPDPVDPLSSELLLENDRLKDQVTTLYNLSVFQMLYASLSLSLLPQLSSMKKQLVQKEQALLDKDKQVSCALHQLPVLRVLFGGHLIILAFLRFAG